MAVERKGFRAIDPTQRDEVPDLAPLIDSFPWVGTIWPPKKVLPCMKLNEEDVFLDVGCALGEHVVYAGAWGVDGKKGVIHALPEHKILNKIKEKLKTANGKKIMRKRQIVEKSFADIKHNRGVRSFTLRGINGVKIEFGLACTASNLVRINNLIKKPPT